MQLLREVDEAPATLNGDIFSLVDGQGDHQVQIGDDPSNTDRVADLHGTEIESQERIYLDINRPCHSRSGAVLDGKPDLCSAALEGAGKHRHESIDGDLFPWKQIENIADGRKGIFSASSAAGQGEGQGAETGSTSSRAPEQGIISRLGPYRYYFKELEGKVERQLSPALSAEAIGSSRAGDC